MYGSYAHGWMFDGGVGMVFGILWMLALLSIPLLVLFALVKYLFSATRRRDAEAGRSPAEKTPLDIVKEAYARGEISRDEYFQKRDDLLEKK